MLSLKKYKEAMIAPLKCFLLPSTSSFLALCPFFSQIFKMVVSINIALLFTSTIGGVLAAPTLLERGKTFSVTAAHNDKFVRNGTAAMLKAYAKYGLHSLHPDSVLRKRQDGSVTATPAAQDVEYLCPVTIGGQTLNLDFDTGSADL